MDISTIPQENDNIESNFKTNELSDDAKAPVAVEPAELADFATKAPVGPNEVDQTADLDQAINLTETALPTSD